MRALPAATREMYLAVASCSSSPFGFRKTGRINKHSRPREKKPVEQSHNMQPKTALESTYAPHGRIGKPTKTSRQEFVIYTSHTSGLPKTTRRWERTKTQTRLDYDITPASCTHARTHAHTHVVQVCKPLSPTHAPIPRLENAFLCVLIRTGLFGDCHASLRVQLSSALLVWVEDHWLCYGLVELAIVVARGRDIF